LNFELEQNQLPEHLNSKIKCWGSKVSKVLSNIRQKRRPHKQYLPNKLRYKGINEVCKKDHQCFSTSLAPTIEVIKLSEKFWYKLKRNKHFKSVHHESSKIAEENLQ
jgi:hypothetical protein